MMQAGAKHPASTNASQPHAVQGSAPPLKHVSFALLTERLQALIPKAGDAAKQRQANNGPSALRFCSKVSAARSCGPLLPIWQIVSMACQYMVDKASSKLLHHLHSSIPWPVAGFRQTPRPLLITSSHGLVAHILQSCCRATCRR